MAQTDACNTFEVGKTVTKEIVLLKGPEDVGRLPPPAFVPLSFSEEYVKQPHLTGAPGYPVDTHYVFEMNFDTGAPVPQGDLDYVSRQSENRDVQIEISTTWLPLMEHAMPKIGLPTSDEVPPTNFDVVGSHYGMTEISYLAALQAANAGAYYIQKSQAIRIFVGSDTEQLSFLICPRTQGAVIAPYCEWMTKLDDDIFITARFRGKHIDDLANISERTLDFVKCIRGDF